MSAAQQRSAAASTKTSNSASFLNRAWHRHLRYGLLSREEQPQSLLPLSKPQWFSGKEHNASCDSTSIRSPNDREFLRNRLSVGLRLRCWQKCAAVSNDFSSEALTVSRWATVQAGGGGTARSRDHPIRWCRPPASHSRCPGPPEVFGHAAPVRQSLPVEWCGQSLSRTPYRDGLVAGLNFAIRRRVRHPPSKYQAPFPSETMTVVVPEFKVMAKHELDFQRPEVRSQKLLCPKYGTREAHK